MNETVDTASNATIGQIKSKMVHKRRLVLAILLRSTGNKFAWKELRMNVRPHSGSNDMTLGGRAEKSLGLANCFNGYSEEEVLGGDDQWYCNVCREHRDITKKLEIYSVPKIFII